jgi:hypothetical protein
MVSTEPEDKTSLANTPAVHNMSKKVRDSALAAQALKLTPIVRDET